MKRLRVILVFAALLGAMAVGLLVGVVLTRWVAVGVVKPSVPTPAVITQIQTLSQLVSVKYVIEKVVVIEDVKWFGENRVLLVAHGVVKGGVDLQRLRPEDLVVEGPTVRIRLPRAEILDAYLDERQTRVIEHSTGLLRTFDKDLQSAARQNAVDDIRRAARVNGILDDAEERAHAQLELLLQGLGFQEVVFEGR